MNLKLICILLPVILYLPYSAGQTRGGITFKKAYDIFIRLLERGTSLDKFIDETFPDGDFNGDGFTDIAEAEEFYEIMNDYRKSAKLKFKFHDSAIKLFEPVDANEDKKISRKEFSKYMKGNRKPYFVLVGFRHFDEDRDGRLNGQELVKVKKILAASGAGDFVKEEEEKEGKESSSGRRRQG